MRNLTILRAVLLVTALAGAVSAQTVSLGDRIGKTGNLSNEYSDFNTRLIQIQTVKSLPFFNKTPTERLSAIRGYYTDARDGNYGKAAGSVKDDFTNGGLVKDVGIAMMTQVLTQVSQGKSMNDAVSQTVQYIMSPEYLIGNLMGGTLGAALGSLIPVPVVGGFLGQLIANVPAMTGAMLGSNIGSKSVNGIRNGDFSLGAIFKSIDWVSLGFQSVGATAGMILGSALPVPFLGQLVGGVLGGAAGLAVAKLAKQVLHLSSPAQDWIASGQYDPSTNVKVPVPAWATSVTGVVTNASAPAAPVSSVTDLDQQVQDAMRRYTSAEATGDKTAASTAYAQYAALKTQLDRARSAR